MRVCPCLQFVKRRRPRNRRIRYSMNETAVNRLIREHTCTWKNAYVDLRRRMSRQFSPHSTAAVTPPLVYDIRSVLRQLNTRRRCIVCWRRFKYYRVHQPRMEFSWGWIEDTEGRIRPGPTWCSDACGEEYWVVRELRERLVSLSDDLHWQWDEEEREWLVKGRQLLIETRRWLKDPNRHGA